MLISAALKRNAIVETLHWPIYRLMPPRPSESSAVLTTWNHASGPNRDARSALLLIFCLCVGWLSAGCSTVRRLPPPGLVPAHELTVFTDGFHSGLILDREALPPDLDPRHDDEFASYPQISLHFGEERWTTGADASTRHALSLVFFPGRGVVQSDHTRAQLVDVPGLRPGHVRQWTFPVTQSGIVRLRRVLRTEWMTGRVLVRPPGENSTLYLSPKAWSVFHSCHDFTVAMLAAAGLELKTRWLYLGGGLAADLDDASAELEAAGIRVIGPP